MLLLKLLFLLLLLLLKEKKTKKNKFKTHYETFVCEGFNEPFRPKLNKIRGYELKNRNVEYGTKRFIKTHTPYTQSMTCVMVNCFFFCFLCLFYYSVFVCDGVNEPFRPKMESMRVCEVKSENVKNGTKRFIKTHTPINQSMDIDMCMKCM